MHYTLVGFSTQLDWRRLNFLEPLPTNMVCSTCGLVRPKTVLLPCDHTLCESCYEQYPEGDPQVCPLDGYQWKDEDFLWTEFHAEELFKRKVKCWNEENGCDYVASVSRIAQHFQGDSRYDYVLCPKCSSAVLWRSVTQHLKDRFCNFVAPLRTHGEGHPPRKETTAFDSSAKGTFKEQVAEANEELGQILSDVKSHGDSLNQISQEIKNFKESKEREDMVEVGKRCDSLTRLMSKDASDEELGLVATSSDAPNFSASVLKLEETPKDETGDVAGQTVHKLSQTEASLKTVKAESQEKNDFSQNTMDCIKSLLRNRELAKGLCVFFVKGVKSLLETAIKTGEAKYESELVYLRGYNLSPGVLIKKQRGFVNMHPLLRLYKGNMDDLVQWPFGHKIKLGVMHPKDGPDLVLEDNANPALHSFQRPMACSNSSTYFGLQSLSLECLFEDGYVENDQLRVMFEVLRDSCPNDLFSSYNGELSGPIYDNQQLSSLFRDFLDEAEILEH